MTYIISIPVGPLVPGGAIVPWVLDPVLLGKLDAQSIAEAALCGDARHHVGRHQVHLDPLGARVLRIELLLWAPGACGEFAV